jgi:poly(3-hydroxybutyrate) depolymerase
MNELNTAQQIHQLLGVAISDGPKQAHGSKNASATKSGPGRHHKAEHAKASPHKNKGASREFVLHTASAEKRDRKLLIALHGRRQWLRMSKTLRRDAV